MPNKAANHLGVANSEGNLPSFPGSSTQGALCSPFVSLQVTHSGPSFVGSFAHFPSPIWPPNVWLPRDLAWVLFRSFQNNLFLSHSLKCHVNVNVPHQISLPDISMNYKLIYSSACFVFPRSNEPCLKPNPPQTPSSTFFPISVTPLSTQNISCHALPQWSSTSRNEVMSLPYLKLLSGNSWLMNSNELKSPPPHDCRLVLSGSFCLTGSSSCHSFTLWVILTLCSSHPGLCFFSWDRANLWLPQDLCTHPLFYLEGTYLALSIASTFLYFRLWP